MSGQHITLYYEEDEAERLDKFLVSALPDYSRSRLQNLIKEGLVLVDGAPARKGGQILERPAVVEISLPAQEDDVLRPEKIPLDIVYEDENLLVVNKPAGMVVHPAAGHDTGTLVHAVLAHAPELEGVGGEKRPGVVHRLDKDTSGLILLAKNDRSYRFLQKQFRLRRVEKTYLTLVDGKPPTPTGRVEAPIGRDVRQRKRMAIVSHQKGREAISEYLTLEVFPKHIYLQVHPVTGRTHQIRLHMAFMGCPVVGDTTYGRRRATIPIKRQFLHAARLTILLPGEQDARTFEAPLPQDLASVLEELRQRV